MVGSGILCSASFFVDIVDNNIIFTLIRSSTMYVLIYNYVVYMNAADRNCRTFNNYIVCRLFVIISNSVETHTHTYSKTT